MTIYRRIALTLVLLTLASWTHGKERRGKEKTIQRESLSAYLERMQQLSPDLAPVSPGSLWTDNGRMVGFAADYKAVRVGDTVRIVVSQDLAAQNAGNVSTNRAFNANSGVSDLGGHISTSGVQNLFSPTSNAVLTGKSQAATTSTLRTSLAGRIVAVLANGVLVVEAERQITMNNERQTLLLRGLIRPGDLAPDNSVASNAIADLELELKGKGVLSDGTRPPNVLTRWLLRLVGF